MGLGFSVLMVYGVVLLLLWGLFRFLLRQKIIDQARFKKHEAQLFYFLRLKIWRFLGSGFEMTVSRRVLPALFSRCLPAVLLLIIIAVIFHITSYFIQGTMPKMTENDLLHWPQLEIILNYFNISLAYQFSGWWNILFLFGGLLILFLLSPNAWQKVLSLRFLSRHKPRVICRRFYYGASKSNGGDLAIFFLAVSFFGYLWASFSFLAFYAFLGILLLFGVSTIVGYVASLFWSIVRKPVEAIWPNIGAVLRSCLINIVMIIIIALIIFALNWLTKL